MADNSFSIHAPTGQTAKTVVSSNAYAQAGRVIGYPTNFDVYTRKLSTIDGTTEITEEHEVSDLLGNRLYLYHRPVVNADGTATTITVTDGTVDTTATNSKQGYIVFTSLPTSTFQVTYAAAPDCVDMWHLNTIQDSVMEIQQILGPTNQTGYAGLRNLAFGLFDTPANATASGVAQRAVFLPHLDQNIYIGSSADAGLAATRGAAHTIQLGRETDEVIIDVTGFKIQQNDGTLNSTITLGTKTGDFLSYKGYFSGAGPMTIGGPEWPNYSGTTFISDTSGAFYSGAMLQVHGDVSIMGGLQAVGAVEIVTTTGTTSIVYGDWTIRDELFVEGRTHLYGLTQTQQLNVQQDLVISSDIVCNNSRGSGGRGQCLVDNLDPSEIAHTYQYVAKTRLQNTVVTGPRLKTSLAPKKLLYRPWFTLDYDDLAGSQYAITGSLNAAVGPSGAHPSIFQLLLTGVAIVSGTYEEYGSYNGIWSPGMMDPGSIRLRMLSGPAAGYDAPIYNYKVEATGDNGVHVTRLNVFTPEIPSPPAQTNNRYMLYTEHSTPYDFIRAVGGANPTYYVSGTTEEPFVVAFDDTVRVMTQSTTPVSLRTALENSISGLGPADSVTGIAYIFADKANTDPEAAPRFTARASMFRMPSQVAVGEVVAHYSGAQWHILENLSYRPNSIYDSSWIPVLPVAGTSTSGRAISGTLSNYASSMKVYFAHGLGPDVDIYRLSSELYAGAYTTGTPEWNKTHTPPWSLMGQEFAAPHNLSGRFTQSSVGTNSNSSIFYLDSYVVGLFIDPDILLSTETANYLRLVLRRDS